MATSGMLHRVALVRTDASEELSASFIRVTRIGELGTTLAVLVTVTSTRATRRNIPEDTILAMNMFICSCMVLLKKLVVIYRAQ
jgi:hypothetical protein